MLLTAKLDMDPSENLMVVVLGTHGSNGGTGMAMVHLFAKPWPLDGANDWVRCCENGPNWMVSVSYKE